jgi:hypothetical protein
MAFSDVALLAGDQDFRARATAAVSIEKEQGNLPLVDDAPRWVFERNWRYAAQPGFGDAYASALAGGVPRPGNDPSVISDAQILAATFAIYASEHPAPTITGIDPASGGAGTTVTITGTGFQEA